MMIESLKSILRSGTGIGVVAGGTLMVAMLVGCSGSTPAPTPPVVVTPIPVATITTVAGTGVLGNSGNGGLATSAQLSQPTCVAMDSAGNLYIGDIVTNNIRKVTASTGIISVYAGTGVQSYTGNGGPATAATFYGPTGCALDAAGNLYVADEANNVIRKITAATGVITTVAGNGDWAGTSSGGYTGDGGSALGAEMNHPWGVVVDASGNLFIADTSNGAIREVNASTGIITTVVNLNSNSVPEGMALDGLGNIYVAVAGKSLVVKVNISTRQVTTIAGTGTSGSGPVTGDGGQATLAVLQFPQGVTVSSAGNVFITDSGNERIREVTTSTGIITSVVGTTVGFSGDGAAATNAQLHNPMSPVFDPSGNLYFADYYNGAVRKVTLLK